VEAQRFLGLTCRELLELLAVLIALAVAEALLPSPRYVVGLITGVVLTASLAIVDFAFLLSGDVTFPIAGATGEPDAGGTGCSEAARAHLERRD